MHVSFDLSVAPGLREGCMDSGLVTPKMSGEVNLASAAFHQPGPRGSLTLHHHAEELGIVRRPLSSQPIAAPRKVNHDPDS